MAGRGRGRGRGRGIKQNNDTPMRPPEPEFLTDLLSKHGSGKETGNTDANEQITQHHLETTPSADTLATEKEAPTLVKEMKKSLKIGTTVQGLNPHSKEFTPGEGIMNTSDTSGIASLNPNSVEFVPSNQPAHPTKHQSSRLNPRTQEFVSGRLNPTASNFVPKQGLPVLMQNGDLEPLEASGGDAHVPTGGGGVTGFESLDVLNGFKRVHPEDTAGESLLKTSAEMLVKATVYPGSYDTLLLKLIAATEPRPSDESLANLAEMIVHWGVLEPALRYTACRMCQELCDKVEGFRKLVLGRVQDWYKKRHTEEPTTEEERCDFISCALFFAELFARIKLGDEPVLALSTAIFNFVERLLNLKNDDTIIGACNIMKLTGSLLDFCDKKKSTEKVDELIVKLQTLVQDKTVSSKCTSVMIQVIALRGNRWTVKSSSVKTVPLPAFSLNTNAPEFIPSTDVQQELQQPVQNAEEWNDYIGDEELLEPDETDGYVFEDYEDDGLDPEIEQDMEAFIDEIEQHLLMQDFDPELPLVHQEHQNKDT